MRRLHARAAKTQQGAVHAIPHQLPLALGPGAVHAIRIGLGGFGNRTGKRLKCRRRWRWRQRAAGRGIQPHTPTCRKETANFICLYIQGLHRLLPWGRKGRNGPESDIHCVIWVPYRAKICLPFSCPNIVVLLNRKTFSPKRSFFRSVTLIYRVTFSDQDCSIALTRERRGAYLKQWFSL